MSDSGSPNRVKRQIGWIMAVFIVLAFAAIIVAKQGSKAAAETPVNPATQVVAQPAVPSGGPAESHTDANAAYEKALTSGKPIYLLFHSLTCVPCVEISEVVDKVIPTYEGKVVFVNAISGDKGTEALLEKFPFQYIPQSFFIDAKGNIVEAYTGAMDEPAMRGYLDKLVAQ